jgi:hypothetical protein
MVVDLRKDAQELRKLLEERTKLHIEKTKKEKLPPVSALEIGFGINQAGWIVINFDTRAEHERDGEWTTLVEKEMVERDHWFQAYEAVHEEDVTFILPDGSEKVIPAVGEDGDENSDARFAGMFGEMIRDVALAANKDGVFKDLPKKKGFQLDIEEFDNMWAWPSDYDDVGKKNLL